MNFESSSNLLSRLPAFHCNNNNFVLSLKIVLGRPATSTVVTLAVMNYLSTFPMLLRNIKLSNSGGRNGSLNKFLFPSSLEKLTKTKI